MHKEINSLSDAGKCFPLYGRSMSYFHCAAVSKGEGHILPKSAGSITTRVTVAITKVEEIGY